MPRASLDEGFRTGGQADQFPSLTLVTGEYARLLIPGNRDEVWYEWVHAFRAPYFNEDGSPVMEDKKRKDGSVYKQVYATTFVGGQICLGDPSVIEGSGNGLDPVRCPACASAVKGTRGMSPDRRWAVPVIRYKCTSRGSTELQVPPMAEILVWSMTQRQYNNLLDVRPEIQNLLDLPPGAAFEWRAADVVVWCEDDNFKRHLFKSPLRPAHRDPKVAELVKALWGTKSNRPTEAHLRVACGKEPDRDFMTTDVDTVEAAWAKLERFENGIPVPDPISDSALSSGQPGQDLDKSLDDLLADHPGGLDEFAPQGSKAAPDQAVDDDLFGEPAAPPAATREPAPAEQAADPFAEEPAMAGAPAAASNGGGRPAQSFDEILAD
jgi:hypothetical protein